jgi:hypothetical protein
VAIVLALALAARLLWRHVRHWTLADTTSALNKGALLIAFVIAAMAVVNGRIGLAIDDLSQGKTLDSWRAGAISDGEGAGPDLYAILLDGYPRADVLEAAFDIDNQPFLDALGERGFDVAPESHGNYIWTHTTVPSALHMDYIERIPELAPLIAGTAPQQPVIRRVIDDNPVFDMARERGYTTISVGSGFEQVTARKADVFIDGGDINEFEISLLASTFAGDIVDLVAPRFVAGGWASRIEHGLDALPAIASEDAGPVLVWGHIPAPHQPTVFGADGSILEVPLTDTIFGDSPMERGEDPAEFRERYRAQLAYLNGRLLETVDGILRRSSEPPVIVLFADHGSSSRMNWIEADPSEVDPELVLERTGILFASLTPGEDDVYPDDPSPIDVFRLFFDAYFGTDYGRAVPPGGGEIPPVDASVFD